MREYDLGHVLTGERYESFVCLFKEKLGLTKAFQIIEPNYATEDDLKLVHTEEYIRRVEKCESRDTHDTPLTPGGQVADRTCQGKVIDFAGSGYDPKGILFPRGWLASICGLTGIEPDLEEPYPLPPGHKRDYAAAETKKILKALKTKLAPYWKCFAS